MKTDTRYPSVPVVPVQAQQRDFRHSIRPETDLFDDLISRDRGFKKKKKKKKKKYYIFQYKPETDQEKRQENREKVLFQKAVFSIT